MQATPSRSYRGQRSRRVASAARLAVLAGLLALLLSPLLSGPTPEPAAPAAPPSTDQPAVAEPVPAPAEARSAASAPAPALSQPRPTRAPLAGRSPDGLALHVLRYQPLIVEIGAEVGADPAVLAALMEVESSGEDAVSQAGALGLMQIMPDKLEPGDDPFDPPTNVRRAAQHVRRLTATWEGDLATVAGAYFGAVDADGYVTDASDGIATGRQYVSRFAAAYRRWAPVLGQPLQPVIMRDRPPAPPVAHHTVQPGDSARGLAARYGISLATLVAANQLADPDLLLAGQQLRIPTVDGVLHTLQPGESLAQLAERYGVPASSLLEANRLAEEPAAGALLVVPGVEPTWTPTPPPSEAAPPEPSAPARVDDAPRPEVSARYLTVRDEVSGPLLPGQGGRAIVASASRDGHRVQVGLIRTQDPVGDGTGLFDWVWRSFAW
jgi:LysM repeat protein/soluble lytic murein transglycosylase-like protein